MYFLTEKERFFHCGSAPGDLNLGPFSPASAWQVLPYGQNRANVRSWYCTGPQSCTGPRRLGCGDETKCAFATQWKRWPVVILNTYWVSIVPWKHIIVWNRRCSWPKPCIGRRRDHLSQTLGSVKYVHRKTLVWLNVCLIFRCRRRANAVGGLGGWRTRRRACSKPLWRCNISDCWSRNSSWCQEALLWHTAVLCAGIFHAVRIGGYD